MTQRVCVIRATDDNWERLRKANKDIAAALRGPRAPVPVDGDSADARISAEMARLINLGTAVEADADITSVVGFADKTATVLVDATEGMTRGIAYELLVTLVASDGDTEPLTLVIECVA